MCAHTHIYIYDPFVCTSVIIYIVQTQITDTQTQKKKRLCEHKLYMINLHAQVCNHGHKKKRKKKKVCTNINHRCTHTIKKAKVAIPRYIIFNDQNPFHCNPYHLLGYHHYHILLISNFNMSLILSSSSLITFFPIAYNI